MKKYITSLALAAVVTLSGCAHQIQINPQTTAFKESKSKISKVVGYHISDIDRAKVVKTPGGGGDKVTYTPYKDTESVLYTVLANKFKDVYLVKDLNDQTFLKENEIKLIFIPTITTDSSSSSPFTWPPTKFTIDLTVKAVNHSGDTVWEQKIQEKGEAEFDEFKSDFSLSARRATEKAFLKLAQNIDAESVLSN